MEKFIEYMLNRLFLHAKIQPIIFINNINTFTGYNYDNITYELTKQNCIINIDNDLKISFDLNENDCVSKIRIIKNHGKKNSNINK